MSISFIIIYTEKMNDKNNCCQYYDPEGFTCKGEANGSGFCFWHDQTQDKSGAEIKGKLETHAKSGGMLRGVFLQRANLTDIDLVNHNHKTGYDFTFADFYRANLNGAHLFNVTLRSGSLMKADLTNANLNCAKLDKANLLGSKWSKTKIEHTSFGARVKQEDLGRAAIKNKNIPAAHDYFEQAEEIYRDLRKHAEHEGIFSLSGAFIHRELTMRRLQLPKFSVKRFSSKMVDLFCGYGEDPIRIISLSILMIFICSILYSITGLNYQGEVYAFSFDQSYVKNLNIFLSSLYYSVVTFTTLGYGDFTPIGISRAFAAIEAFTGSFTIALFVVVFVKKMTR